MTTTDSAAEGRSLAAKLLLLVLRHSALTGEWDFGVQPDGGGERLYFRDSILDFERLVESEKELMIRKGQRFFGVYAGHKFAQRVPTACFSNVVSCLF